MRISAAARTQDSEKVLVAIGCHILPFYLHVGVSPRRIFKVFFLLQLVFLLKKCFFQRFLFFFEEEEDLLFKKKICF